MSLELVVEPLQAVGETLKGILDVLKLMAFHCQCTEDWWSTEKHRRGSGEPGQQRQIAGGEVSGSVGLVDGAEGSAERPPPINT
ncbi:hypothetical protein BU17DRAFT_87568 [Hysterangium stoloniferum]|nr:hypothetical protein BU17DRAFT_87568 [Hysterangium stoloniferum]